jgi:hypothetical protein
MQNRSFLKIAIVLTTITCCSFYESNGQVVAPKSEKKSSQDVFFPNRKKASPVIVHKRNKRTYPIVVRNEKTLPPGQAKKIYGEKSAKRFAPGQRKKSYHHSSLKNGNSKYLNKKTKDNKKKKAE